MWSSIARKIKEASASINWTTATEGKFYQSTNISQLTSNCFSYRTAQRLIEKYPAGQVITVYHNPDNPQEAILRTGPIMTKLFIPRFFMAIAIFLWAIYYLSVLYSKH